MHILAVGQMACLELIQSGKWCVFGGLQVTIRVARDMNPRRIIGMDIDSKLVGIAWKNLHR